MQPRLHTSTHWTAFPEEFTSKILQVFNENFAARLQDGEFLTEGRIYPQEILLQVGYLPKGSLRQINFHASVDYSQKTQEQAAFNMIYLCVDAIGGVFEQYFSSHADEDEGELDFPRNWEAVEVDEGIVWMQFSTDNTRLEAEAEKWLNAGNEKALVREQTTASEDALSRAVIDNDLALETQKKIRQGTPLN